MEPEKKPPAVSDVGAWAMNVVSSVGIIMANKQLMSSSGYAFAFGTVRLLLLSLPVLAERRSGSAAALVMDSWGFRGSDEAVVCFSPCERVQPPR